MNEAEQMAEELADEIIDSIVSELGGAEAILDIIISGDFDGDTINIEFILDTHEDDPTDQLDFEIL